MKFYLSSTYAVEPVYIRMNDDGSLPVLVYGEVAFDREAIMEKRERDLFHVDVNLLLRKGWVQLEERYAPK